MSEDKKSIKIEDETLTGKVYKELEKVEDPELGIDIVNLGLIYEVILYENSAAEIKMTLTTLGCPFADQIKNNVRERVEAMDEINHATIKLVWYPAWTPERMSRYAKMYLGIH